MTNEDLFEELDLDGDGKLSRSDLGRAARLFGWHWQEAPFFACLDFLTVRGAVDRETFGVCMRQIADDPDGAYGEVLRRGLSGVSSAAISHPKAAAGTSGMQALPTGNRKGRDSLAGLLANVAGNWAAAGYLEAMERLQLPVCPVRQERTALLIIDPQRSFTCGEWMRSMGAAGETETLPIRLAFDACARLLRAVYGRIDAMFTRCPFPPESYGWDKSLEDVLDDEQAYFIKPGNNIFVPPTNGCREWIETLAAKGVTTLVLGGCTLNSCVRVSAIAARKAMPGDRLEVLVDLGLCGARTANYLASHQFGGMSPVESAILQMRDAGVVVTEAVEWCP